MPVGCGPVSLFDPRDGLFLPFVVNALPLSLIVANVAMLLAKE